MDDLSVVHANELVEASYSLSINEIRVIALACTKYDSRKGCSGEVRISVSEFAKLFSIENKRTYGDLRDAVKSIMRKPIKLYDSNNKEAIELAWLTKHRYSAGETGSCVYVKFSPEIEPYLFELKERFTKIDFKYAARLNTPFSFRLYQWLKKSEHIRSNKHNGVVIVELGLNWMQERSQFGNYKRWGDIKERAIQPAINKINSETDLSVMWEPVKSGRSVYAVKFSYVIEKAAFAKPIRPRLYRRPKVVKGSHEEGSWMRKNLSLLLSYREELKKYDSSAKLDIKDLERIAEYSSICDRVIHKKALKELVERRSKKTKTV
jgi:plasmid replication initiation protein